MSGSRNQITHSQRRPSAVFVTPKRSSIQVAIRGLHHHYHYCVTCDVISLHIHFPSLHDHPDSLLPQRTDKTAKSKALCVFLPLLFLQNSKKTSSTFINVFVYCIYSGVDKSLALPGRKKPNVSVRMA